MKHQKRNKKVHLEDLSTDDLFGMQSKQRVILEQDFTKDFRKFGFSETAADSLKENAKIVDFKSPIKESSKTKKYSSSQHEIELLNAKFFLSLAILLGLLVLLLFAD